MLVLGIWDGHDSGACVVEDGKIMAAINEERLSRRKLEVGFPFLSVSECLSYLGLKPSNINAVAVSTTDFSKTLTRVFPSLKEGYYKFRRRKIEKPRFVNARRKIKYTTTKWGGFLTEGISRRIILKNLKSLGFDNPKLYFVDHHMAHAASACFTSGFPKSLCITVDGVGDKLSATVNVFENGEIRRIASSSAENSVGIFFEQVTTLLGMRELEDEGKVMCMADYSFPIKDENNKMVDFFSVDGLEIKSKFSTNKRYSILEKIVWNNPREHVAYMAQRVLEKTFLDLFKNSIEHTGLLNVCWSGGVASNVKANMTVRLNTTMRNWFVFPHMGDGGLAAGAALYINNKLTGTKSCRLTDAYLGPNHTPDLRMTEFEVEERNDVSEYTGDLISSGNYVLWFQGRMEYGPRALGNRSIVASAASEKIKDLLNLHVKKREWYQPFCPSLAEEEGNRIFENCVPDHFMTMAYMARPEIVSRIRNVVNIDCSARPQMVGSENPAYRKIIEQVKKNTGDGIILNTSFNLHGFPIVNTPEEAIDVMRKTGSKHLIINNYVVSKK